MIGYRIKHQKQDIKLHRSVIWSGIAPQLFLIGSMGEERIFSSFPTISRLYRFIGSQIQSTLHASYFLIQSFLNSIRFCNNWMTEQLQVCFGSSSLNMIVPENETRIIWAFQVFFSTYSVLETLLDSIVTKIVW